ncbi:MAG TPA: CbiX/SirB N-terminal domain-containing protein, partial [Microthrixaceae bacterium]|nr:CbiX/SirB N-terminal domain-containing protein [Microthrixaceae bacterium]
AVVDHDDGPYRGAVAHPAADPPSAADPSPEADHRPDAVTLLVAHGSRNARATADHTALCNAVADESGRTVRPAFLEISEPSIGDAVDAAVRDGARVVTVVPLFVHAGNHVEVDIPGIVDAARLRHSDVDIDLRPHLGATPDFVRMVADQL